MKFSTRKEVELHIIKKYLYNSDKSIQFEAQYIQVIKSDENINLKNLYYALSEQKRMKTENKKEKRRKHKATEIEKEKCRDRKTKT